MNSNISHKVGRILNLIIVGFMLILVRVWYLSVVAHEEHVALARKPQRRTVIERAPRATIRDRFNIPLALNKIQYNAAVCYADIQQIPRISWKTVEGKKVRVFERSAHIEQLATFLSRELSLDKQDVEDTIYGKASLFPHTPFVIKENIPEELFYRLKMLEKDWVGIRMQRDSVRYYPKGKTGSDVIGYMGAIAPQEYAHIAQEMKLLQSYIADKEAGEMPFLPKGFHHSLEVRERLKQLEERAYTIHDLVGKAGVEHVLDEELRGTYGKKLQEVDVKGHVLRTLPGRRPAAAGERLLLSISSELQEFSEKLLAENERFREVRKADGSINLKQPWIRGGAIVAMDPRTGEVLSLASYPRFDPNDFIPSHAKMLKQHKHKEVSRWLENEAYIGSIWDGKRPLERERFDKARGFYDETLDLTWSRYLEAILPEKSSVFQAIQRLTTLSSAVALQHNLEMLLSLSGQTDMGTLVHALYAEVGHSLSPEEKTAREHLIAAQEKVFPMKQALDAHLSSIPNHRDKLLLIDLCHLSAPQDGFSSALLEQIGSQSLSSYRSLCQSSAIVQAFLLTHIQELFHKWDFQSWRENHFKELLKSIRKEEKRTKQYTRPYTEYLEKLERNQFKTFFQQFRWELLEALLLEKRDLSSQLQPYLDALLSLSASDLTIVTHIDKLKQALTPLPQHLCQPYLKTMRTFDELTSPLYGRYKRLRTSQGVQLEKHLACAFYPLTGFGYGRSQAYRQSTPQGSVFKLVVAYQALVEKFQQLGQAHKNINPLTLIDQMHWTVKPGSNGQILGFTLDGHPYTRLYKGGRLPRSHPNVGKIDLIGALEQSSNLYFPILALEHIQDPSHLIDACRHLGFGEKTGIELPGEIRGILPDDLADNRTGLYSFAIGQHSLVVTPLQTAVMLSAIAAQGQVPTPKIIHTLSGNDLNSHPPIPCPFQETLRLIGINFPLFLATQAAHQQPSAWHSSQEPRRTIFMPEEIRAPLLEGMRRVISGPRGTARPNIIRLLHEQPELMRDYQSVKPHFVGKTGTAEILYKQTLDAESEAAIWNHIWFSGISFTEQEDPEIVVVVYLRFSEAGGKEAAPLAAAVVNKWREILKKNEL